VALVDNEWMPTAAAIRAKMKESGVRTIGAQRVLARLFADHLAEDEQIVDMVKAFVLKKDGNTITSGDGAMLLALTDRRLVLGMSGAKIGTSFTGLPFYDLSDLSALDRGRFEWRFMGVRWTYIPPLDLVRVGANEARANRFYESLKSRLPA